MNWQNWANWAQTGQTGQTGHKLGTNWAQTGHKLGTLQFDATTHHLHMQYAPNHYGKGFRYSTGCDEVCRVIGEE